MKLSREKLRALINEMDYLDAPSSDIQAPETPAFPSVDDFVTAADPGEHDSDYGSEQGMFQSEAPTINGRMNELLSLSRKLINLENAFEGLQQMDGVFGSQEAEESKWYVDLYYLIEDRANRVKSGVYDKPGKRQEQEFNLGFQVITQKLTNMINNMARHFTLIAKGVGGFFKLNNLLKMVGLNIFESKMYIGRKYTDEELEAAEALNDAHFGVRNGYQIVRSMINIVRDPILSEVYLSDIERLLVAIKTQFETGDAIFTMKESSNKGNKMKITKKQLRNLINEIVMLDDDGGFSGYAGLDKVGPDHALNHRHDDHGSTSLYPKINPAMQSPLRSEDDLKAVKLQSNHIQSFRKELEELGHPTPHVYVGQMVDRIIKGDLITKIYNDLITKAYEDLNLGAPQYLMRETSDLNESLSRGSLYRRRYYGRY